MEIEIRAFAKNLKEIETKLINLKAKKIKQQHIIDYWFCPKNFTNFKQIQMNKPGSYSLRIRQLTEKDRTLLELNTKAISTEKDHNIFIEHETHIDNLEETKEILEAIGFKVYCVLEKTRTVFQKNNMLINLEDIKGFNPAVEIEILADKETDIHKKTIEKTLKELGIKEKDVIKTSITNLFMKEYAFKQKHLKL